MKSFTERLAKHKTCPFYEEGACCRACYMGPCRITDKAKEGVCGATDSTISARNLGRMAAAGASSLSTAALSISGSQNMQDWFSSQEVAPLAEEKGLDISRLLPPERVALLNRLHLTPRNVQREIVELLHRVSIGVDQECEHILFQTIRMSLGSVLSAALLPMNEKTSMVDVDTSVLSMEKPNVILFGNVQWSNDDRVNAIRIDSLLSLETLLASGLVDVIFCDKIPLEKSVKYVAACYHTSCISAVSASSEVVAKAIENQVRRTQILNFKGTISQPKLSAGILKDALMDSNIRGIVWLAGCIDPRLEDTRRKIVEELAAQDILVLITGCSVNQIIDTGLLHQPIAPVGEFLREFCEKTGIPPVVYLGSCLKEGAVIKLLNEITKAAAIGDFSSLPVGLILPSWRSERNISLMLGALACGISVQVSSPLPVNSEVRKFLENSCNELILGHLLKGDASILEYINRKRERLSLASSLSVYVPKTSIHEDDMDKIAAAAFSIYKELGYGLSADVYKNALVVELQELGLQSSMVKVPINYLGSIISENEELLVENAGIVCIGKDAAVKERLKKALSGTDKEQGMYIVFDKEMLMIGHIDLTKRSVRGGV
ncbi:MAG: GxxExxY protein [bacterium]|nr:GxxExxY protein [bacterium]